MMTGTEAAMTAARQRRQLSRAQTLGQVCPSWPSTLNEGYKIGQTSVTLR